jgi:hypothetical protein
MGGSRNRIQVSIAQALRREAETAHSRLLATTERMQKGTEKVFASPARRTHAASHHICCSSRALLSLLPGPLRNRRRHWMPQPLPPSTPAIAHHPWSQLRAARAAALETETIGANIMADLEVQASKSSITTRKEAQHSPFPKPVFPNA